MENSDIHETDESEKLSVYIDLMDDDGHTMRVLAVGTTVEEAVRAAEDRAGGSWCMNDWSAA